MSRKVFTAGEVLAAADVNSFLMDQTVMSFAGTAARGSAIPSPANGMVTYLEDSDSLQIYDGSTFAQAVSTNAWTAYTPTATPATGAFTTVSATGSFKLVGKTCHVAAQVSITTNGTGAGRVRITLPFTQTGFITMGTYRENNITGESGQVFVSGNLAQMATDSNGYPGGNGYGLLASFIYEVA
jgi:hypothetical protein